MKLKKGDKVKILNGKDKNREGKIEKVFLKTGAVLLPGLNLYKKHLKQKNEKEKGGIIEISRPIKASRVMLICPKCNRPTRIGYKIGQEKQRICKKCQTFIDKK